jgi:hypothetical protein
LKSLPIRYRLPFSNNLLLIFFLPFLH